MVSVPTRATRAITSTPSRRALAACSTQIADSRMPSALVAIQQPSATDGGVGELGDQARRQPEGGAGERTRARLA